MNWIFKAVLLSLLPFTCVLAQSAAPDAGALTDLLHEFLAGASRNDASVHDKFWADDLVYTGSAGRRIGKADIMKDVRSAPPPKPDDPKTVFSAEDVRIREYGDTAVVAFRLVATTTSDGTNAVSKYLNTGTFYRHGDKWQAVAWQSTKLPRAEDEARKEVAAVEAAFQQATRSGDVKQLEALLDETFVRTLYDGVHQTRHEALEEVRSGNLSSLKTLPEPTAALALGALVLGRMGTPLTLVSSAHTY